MAKEFPITYADAKETGYYRFAVVDPDVEGTVAKSVHEVEIAFMRFGTLRCSLWAEPNTESVRYWLTLSMDTDCGWEDVVSEDVIDPPSFLLNPETFMYYWLMASSSLRDLQWDSLNKPIIGTPCPF